MTCIGHIVIEKGKKVRVSCGNDANDGWDLKDPTRMICKECWAKNLFGSHVGDEIYPPE